MAESMISCLSDLIRLRSICGVDFERAVAERICAECRMLKLQHDLIAAPGHEDRPNVVVTAGLFSEMHTFSKDIFSMHLCRLGSIEVCLCRSHGYCQRRGCVAMVLATVCS